MEFFFKNLKKFTLVGFLIGRWWKSKTHRTLGYGENGKRTLLKGRLYARLNWIDALHDCLQDCPGSFILLSPPLRIFVKIPTHKVHLPVFFFRYLTGSCPNRDKCPDSPPPPPKTKPTHFNQPQIYKTAALCSGQLGFAPRGENPLPLRDTH